MIGDIFNFVGNVILYGADLLGVPGRSSMKLSDDYPKREARAPYPQGSLTKALPPINKTDAAAKGTVLKSEFWEAL
jgi:hypothetical protein